MSSANAYLLLALGQIGSKVQGLSLVQTYEAWKSQWAGYARVWWVWWAETSPGVTYSRGSEAVSVVGPFRPLHPASTNPTHGSWLPRDRERARERERRSSPIESTPLPPSRLQDKLMSDAWNKILTTASNFASVLQIIDYSRRSYRTLTDGYERRLITAEYARKGLEEIEPIISIVKRTQPFSTSRDIDDTTTSILHEAEAQKRVLDHSLYQANQSFFRRLCAFLQRFETRDFIESRTRLERLKNNLCLQFPGHLEEMSYRNIRPMASDRKSTSTVGESVHRPASGPIVQYRKRTDVENEGSVTTSTESDSNDSEGRESVSPTERGESFDGSSERKKPIISSNGFVEYDRWDRQEAMGDAQQMNGDSFADTGPPVRARHYRVSICRENSDQLNGSHVRSVPEGFTRRRELELTLKFERDELKKPKVREQVESIASSTKKAKERG
ncbi:hypothetical protein MMC09_006445 [Bachmanniomyces sp. S44760]|nr:hypothetical protein [Bachmanniomyces sp. S44760]